MLPRGAGGPWTISDAKLLVTLAMEGKSTSLVIDTWAIRSTLPFLEDQFPWPQLLLCILIAKSPGHLKLLQLMSVRATVFFPTVLWLFLPVPSTSLDDIP